MSISTTVASAPSRARRSAHRARRKRRPHRSRNQASPWLRHRNRPPRSRRPTASRDSRVSHSLATLLAGLRPVEKTLLLNLDGLGLPLDNVEGMAFGPDLPDGRRSLVLVSDNNFAPAQFTQFLLFSVKDDKHDD